MKKPFRNLSLMGLFTVVLVTGFLNVPVFAQETGSCAEKLRTAQLLFDKGQVSQVPVLINGCLKSGFNREEAITAYKLQIQSFLFEDRFAEADSAMLAFLKKYPEYQLSPTDHSSFVFLYNSFIVKPVLQFSFHVGTNMPFISLLGNPISNSAIPHYKNYSMSALNLAFSVESKLSLSSRLDLNVEVGLSTVSFSNSENFLEYLEIKYTEKQTRLEIPVGLTYDIIRLGNFGIYGRGGVGTSITLSATATPEYFPTDANNYEERPLIDIPRVDSRIFLDLFAQAGVGIKLKIPGAFVFLEGRSSFGFFNQVVRNGESAAKLAWDYYYTDDDFRMNHLNFNIGYTRIIYKASKRR